MFFPVTYWQQGGFNPLDLTAFIWLDARVGVTHSSGAVSNWADQSGNGIDAAQAIGSLQPEYSSTMFNGTHDGLDFASDQLQTGTLPSALGVMTTFIVFYYDTVPNGATMIGSTSGNHDKRIFSGALSPDKVELWDGGTTGLSTNSRTPLSSPTIVAIREESGGTYDQRYNDEAWSSPITISSLTSNTDPLRIGNWGGSGSRYFDGKLAQILIYNKVLSDDDSELVFNYFNQIYSIY